MEKLKQYRQWIQQVLAEHNKYKPAYGDLDQFTVFDQQGDHYQLITIGWEGDRRIFSCLVHIDVKDEKIWIQHDGTEVGIANELTALGVPKQSIILGYQDPDARKLTEFAVS